MDHWWNNDWQGNTEGSARRKICSNVNLYITHPHFLNSGHCCELRHGIMCLWKVMKGSKQTSDLICGVAIVARYKMAARQG
jgi:hypothetical protein